MNPILREITAGIMFIVMGVHTTLAQAPSWWSEQNVISTTAPPDDYAAINQGQLKALAYAAYRAMESRLEDGAGATLTNLVFSWQQPSATVDDYAVVTAGQLKKIAQPFYDRLNAVSGTTGYPWSSSTSADDFSMVNIGQAKRMFSFIIPRMVAVTQENAELTGNPTLPLNITMSQPFIGQGGAGSFSFAHMHKSAEDGGDPSQNVWWEVAKVSLSYAEDEELLNNEIEEKLIANMRLGKRIRGETKKNFGTECKPVDLEPPPDFVNKQCACQHGTPARFKSYYNYLTGQSSWIPTSTPAAGELYMCDEVRHNIKKDYVCMRFRINQSLGLGVTMNRDVRYRWKKNGIEDVIQESQQLAILGNGNEIQSRESTWCYFMLGDNEWIEIDAEDSASDSDPEEISVNDAAGPRYRKVGLNGVPMPDSKPQVQSENGEDDEETYIDAFSAHLKHSVSDVYVTDAATLLPLSVRRDVVPDAWNNRQGLRPHERPYEPFGPGWSSNLCSYVKFTQTASSLSAEVIDEMGNSQRFKMEGGRWYHDGQEARDIKSAQNLFSTSAPDSTAYTIPGTGSIIDVFTFNNITLVKKFGTACSYRAISPANLLQIYTSDRLEGKGGYIIQSYARLERVVDRMTNELAYHYPFNNTLIPDKIDDPNRPGHQIFIQQNDGHVLAVRGPGGDLITYQYSEKQGIYPKKYTTNVGYEARVLSSVTKNFNDAETVGLEVVQYDYKLDQVRVKDLNDTEIPLGQTVLASEPTTVYTNLELTKITDERQGVYSFDYVRNNSVIDHKGRLLRGLPMFLEKVHSPVIGDTVIRIGNKNLAPFTKTNPRLNFNATITRPTVRVSINPPVGGDPYVYDFENPQPIPPAGLTANPDSVTMGYKLMTIKAPDDGVEKYYYDHTEPGTAGIQPMFSMLLTSVRDRNNQQTRFEYDDMASFVINGHIVKMPFPYDDPTREIRVDGTNRHIVKTMKYDEKSRILLKTTVNRGNVAPITEISTTYGIDNLFRRTTEISAGRSGSLTQLGTPTQGTVLPGGSKKTLGYGHAVFPGFVMTETLESAASSGTASTPSLAEVPKITKSFSTSSDNDPALPSYSPAWWRTITETVNFNNPAEFQGQGVNLNVKSETTTWYDFNGNKRRVKDGRNQVTQFEYDGRNRLRKVIHPDESYKSLFYDEHGNLKREVDEEGTTTFHEYDALNRRTKTTLDLNQNGVADDRYTIVTVDGLNISYNGDIVTETSYNRFNLPDTQKDPRGIVTLYEYDKLGRLKKKTVNSTGTLKQEYSYKYKVAGINEGKEAGGTLFDTSGFKPVQVTDPRGFTTSFEYDSLYRQVREIRPDPETLNGPNISIIHKTYDDTDLLVSVSEPTARSKTAVNVTSTVYNAQGKPERVTYPDHLPTAPRFTQTYYTPSGQPWKTVDETGLESRIHYNTAGLPIRTVVMSGSGTVKDPNPTTATAYDAAGNPQFLRDPRGYVTEQKFDNRNRVEKVISPPVDNAAVTPPVKVKPETQTSYDAVGRVLTVTDPLNRVSRTFYDAAGRARLVVDALNQPSVITYNPVGAVLTTTNSLHQTITNVYDELGRLETTTDHAQIVNRFGYDLAGNRTSVKDGKNQETTFVYDAFGRLTSQSFANTDKWTYSYFTPASGSTAATYIPENYLDKASQTDPSQRVTKFTYDKRHRLTKMLRTRVAAPENYDLEATYVYGTTGLSAGRLSSVENKTLGASVTTGGPVPTTVTTNYTYDKLGRIVTERNNGLTHTYGYDLAGNRDKASLKCGSSVTRVISTQFDALNRPSSIKDDNATPGTTVAASADDLITSYGYDLAGRALTLSQPNSQKTINTYDALGRLSTRTLKSAAGVPQATFGWFYYEHGGVKEQTESWAAAPSQVARTRSTVNTYDDSQRLWTETITEVISGVASPTVKTTYTYDDAHNRKTKLVEGGTESGFWDYIYNNANQLTGCTKAAAGGSPAVDLSYIYDDNGNRTQSSRRIGGAAAQVTNYQWNAWDKLIGVNLPDGKKYSYTYDYRTRRVATAQAASGGLVAKHTAITFSGGLSVAEFERATNTTLSVPAVQYIRGPDMGGGVGGLLRTVRNPVSSTTGLPIAPTAAIPVKLKYNLSNGRGDIVAQSDSTGALTWTASYEAYGKRTKETGTNADKQRANTKDEDPTGLLNEGFRYRDIETGVWLSRDPAGFVDGPNLYAYVKQNPWTAFDPDGLKLRVPKSKSNEVDAYIRKNGVSGHQVQQGNQSTKGGEPIDTITGSASHDKSLTSEIIARMISSPREFSFKNASDFDAHVNARKANVEYIEKLAKTVGFTQFGGKYPASSWNEVFTGGRRKDGSQRSRWEPSTDWMTALTELRDKGGMLDCSKPGEFGRMMGDYAHNRGEYDKMGNYSGSLSRTTLEAVKDDWIPGDQGKLWNKNPGAPSFWINENFTSLGRGLFYANGTQIGGSYIHSFDAVFNFTRDMGQPAGQTGVNPTIDQNRNHVKTGLSDGL